MKIYVTDAQENSMPMCLMKWKYTWNEARMTIYATYTFLEWDRQMK